MQADPESLGERAALSPIVAGFTGALFGGLSRLRGRRIFHPKGVGFEASFDPLAGSPSGAEILDDGRARPAIVRLSRSIGLPESLGDPCGVAIRLSDAYGAGHHQDFLLVSSGAAPIARHLLLPARGFAGRSYSSLLPYRVGTEAILVGAKAELPGPGPSLAELADRDRADLEFQICLATPRGEWRPVARLGLGGRLADEETERLAFDPTHSGGGFEPIGFLNYLRAPAYRASQAGRRAGLTPIRKSIIG